MTRKPTLANMKYWRGLLLGLALIFACIILTPNISSAETKPSLVISQFKITTSDGQFFMLHNTTDEPIDMGSVQLVYYNHYNLASASSSKVITLSGHLPAKGYYLVNDGPLTLCYRMIVNSLNLGLSSTAGSVQIARLSQNSPGAPVKSTVTDSVSWSKTAVSGVNQLPAAGQFLLRNPVDDDNNPNIIEAGSGTWLKVAPDLVNPCLLTSTNSTAPPPVISASLLLLSSTPPPVTILNLLSDVVSGPYLPAANIGLMAPVINELLPNPGKPGTDANDEFIELYNPNEAAFELTGFELEVGLNTKRKWMFPEGTMLAGKSFTAFYSSLTGLSLSNTSGQARLLDPFGNVISVSEEYGTAKDNLAWALANNEWHWTVVLTPNAANVIDAGQTKSAATKKSKKGTGTSGVRAATTGGENNLPDTFAVNAVPEVVQLHPSALASVAVLAVGYSAYEYKQDITNRLRRFRADRAARRIAGGKS